MNPNLPYLLLIALIPLVGAAFVLCGTENTKKFIPNAWAVAILTIVTDLILILRAFYHIKTGYGNMQLSETYVWWEMPRIELTFAVDSFSLLLLLGVFLAVLVGMWFEKNYHDTCKPRIVFALFFLTSLSGFFMAADVFSFFIFFLIMLLPLFMLIGLSGDIKKQAAIFRFMLYNLFGAMLLFAAVIILYNHQNHSILLGDVSSVKLREKGEITLWLTIFVAFLSRIPIWPFHYWIASVNAALKNPLVFVVANLMPLTGIYGFIRFWPNTVPDTAAFCLYFLEIIGVISMFFIALIGVINKDINYKIFAFVTVYYIFFLLGIFLPTDQFILNLGFSLFAFLLIFAAIASLTAYVENALERENLKPLGIFSYMPRVSLCLAVFILAAVGLPLSAMFVNNFVVFAALLDYNIISALLALVALSLAAMSLLREFFLRKSPAPYPADTARCLDIAPPDLCFFLSAAAVLILSFFNPLWFLRG